MMVMEIKLTTTMYALFLEQKIINIIIATTEDLNSYKILSGDKLEIIALENSNALRVANTAKLLFLSSKSKVKGKKDATNGSTLKFSCATLLPRIFQNLTIQIH